VRRVIVGFEQDARGDWIARLSCGHKQHIRHRPPFEVRPWVLAADSREARIGTDRDCPLCDRPEAVEGTSGDSTLGGEPACFAHLVCEQCGVVLDGSPHAPDCSYPV
jgi:hypothetical protein